MDPRRHNGFILVAEDDEDDHLLIRDALKDNGFRGNLRFVCDGWELMDYLRGCKRQEESQPQPYPDVILLDLNMPKMDGREALREIKADDTLSLIPVVVLTTSSEERDIELCSRLGANSFITKPSTYDQWVELIGHVNVFLSGRYGTPQRV